MTNSPNLAALRHTMALLCNDAKSRGMDHLALIYNAAAIRINIERMKLGRRIIAGFARKRDERTGHGRS